jgi:2-methylisocitrate lyase-like PEP mutase family enzyme
MTTADSALADSAERFRALHRPGSPVVLPNVWDAASARVVAEAGFPAIATSSAAVARSLGFEDGGTAPPAEMFAAAARIARAVALPVTVDAENGYGLSAAELVRSLVAARAVGCNIEDSTAGVLLDVETHASRLTALREAASAVGLPLVINARVDVFVRNPGRPEAELVDSAVARANRYLAAGADCAYPIGRLAEATVGALTAGIRGPVNVLWTPAGPSVALLTERGAARISAGGGLWQVAMEAFRSAVEGLRPDAGRRP